MSRTTTAARTRTGTPAPGRRTTTALARALPLALLLTACGGSPQADDSAVTVTIGYQSKTINTVTAGTLLRSLGHFERELRALGERDGRTYRVVWQDYATGAPITAQMTAGKIDIGSMGDFPLLLNAARGRQLDRPTKLVSVTGYNLRGALNTIVTAPGSSLTTLEDLRGRKVSTSVGSAADGTLVRALEQKGITVRKLNQQPAVGASALSAGSIDALSQFVAWPGLLAFQGKAKALYDGGELNVPTFHGVTTRAAFAEQHPGVVDAFLRAQRTATAYLRTHPVDASRKVAAATGLPAEVVHLYNGPNGIATFDPTIKPRLVAALKQDVPILVAAGLVRDGDVDVDAFVDDSHIRRVYGAGYAEQRAALAPPSRSEVWLGDGTTTFATPAEALRHVAAHRDRVRAAYVPDTTTGTLWFADRSVWLQDGDRRLPFQTRSAADAYRAAHPNARLLTYEQALRP
ncbi:ABC transporter substrate-binding protein [Streptomyces sp. NRRL S-118]|uniref:ABC transporter substrate-binding protein n=1 Tax=Streptomyces sp. NRRL S-118 TaxID=1463881 RepID=UPI0006944623|nr:ABC transporter substrate-binding protein [Streptomyces sp. NRRL S-118]